MRKARFVFPFLFVLLLSTSVYAQELLSNSNHADLHFSDTTVYCYVRIRAADSKSNISATIELWNGSQRIGGWEKSATGSLVFSKDVSVEKGKTYKLTVSYTIDADPQPLLSSFGTC